MRIITIEDFIDVYQKTAQRGLGFFLSKFNPSGLTRTKTAFNDSNLKASNWWIIPKIKQRWNYKITGDEHTIYEDYLMQNHLAEKQGLKMLSIGSGVCSHELHFATYKNFDNITCIDIAENLLDTAKNKADNLNLKNINFLVEDIYKTDFEKHQFDIILFHSSLHHFSNIEGLITEKVMKWLTPDGQLIINEYVGKDRLQFDRRQLKKINDALKTIPQNLRKRFKTGIIKRRYYGSGLLRMILADPSECIESSKILPVLRENFKVIEEKPYGGNLLMSVLKDIAHNFIDGDNKQVKSVLSQLFEIEDEYLANHPSDFIFGIYGNKEKENIKASSSTK